MHLPTLCRKFLFVLTGKLYLADPVRNFTYNWVWKRIKKLKIGTSIIDIGSRESLFPAFLGWRRYRVTVIERDERFIVKQKQIFQRWNTYVEVEGCDFLTFCSPHKYDVICSLYSLQHAGGNNDIRAYEKIGDLLKEGGFFFSATEYNSIKTKFQRDRDDGEMRIYSNEDIKERIEKPLNKRKIIECERCYLKVTAGKVILSEENEATIILMKFKKLNKKQLLKINIDS
ncbi:MAG: class I SAM-dependent methyltransferase [Chitinispirillaceae bacterium]|nr:class I SAM-dependent methyltransferase [Chitinispirillaceae bacterium]